MTQPLLQQLTSACEWSSAADLHVVTRIEHGCSTRDFRAQPQRRPKIAQHAQTESRKVIEGEKNQ